MVGIGLIILLAIVQGLLEWLPVSSEGQIVLILNWFGEPTNAVAIALFLHLGTMLAVLIRFRNDLLLLFNIKSRKKEENEKNAEGRTIEVESFGEEKFTESEKRKILCSSRNNKSIDFYAAISSVCGGSRRYSCAQKWRIASDS